MKRWFPIMSSLLLLGVLSWGTWWVVQTQRPPGAMTPLEAQGMDMTVMKPPRGTFPVEVEEVQSRPFLPTVSYPATFRAFNEEIVRARITGKLLEAFVYPGDMVRSGQLLARIEPEEYQARAQKSLGELLAVSAQVEAAQAEVQEVEASLQSALARHKQALEEVNEARQLLRASDAQLRTASTELEQLDAEIRSAQAEAEFWQAESERLNTLLEKGFVSKRDAQSAQTRLVQARERLQSAQSARRTQLARIEQLQAGLEAMRARLQRAEASVQVAEQEVKAMRARLQSAKARQRSAQSLLTAQRGSLRAEQLQVSYTRITALNPGIITERLTEPGTLVEPGTPIFRLQNTQQVRVQAKVADKDAVRLRVGYPVWIKRYAEPNRVYRARITAIFREADVNTRTTIVEALLPNKEGQFVVGEYAEMRIGLQPTAKPALSVPQRAVRYDEFQRPFVWVLEKVPHSHDSHPTTYTCPMHPQIEQDTPGTCPLCKMDLVPKEQPADYVARKRYVKVGLTDGERIQVVEGLKTGDQVIVFGYDYLTDGDPVFPTEWTARGPAQINPPQFQPSSPSHLHEH